MKNKSILKITKSLLTGLLLCIGGLGYALEYKVLDTQPHALGLERSAQTETGLAFTLAGPEKLSASQEAQVQYLLQTFSSWEGIVVKSLKIQLTGQQAEAVLLPQSLDVGGVDLSTYLPSGMWFVFKDYLEFDFRLAVKNVFVRMQGGFFDLSDFKNRLKDAVDNPVAYIQKNDPLYLFNKLSELQKEITDARARELLLKQTLENAQSAIATLQSSLSILQYAGTALANRDFFGGMHPMDPAEVEKVLKIKEASPDKQRKAVFAEYKGQGGKILSESEVFLVMAVYHKDFSN